MLDQCFECSRPIPNGEQYCRNCSEEDGISRQLKILFGPPLSPSKAEVLA